MSNALRSAATGRILRLTSGLRRIEGRLLCGANHHDLQAASCRPRHSWHPRRRSGPKIRSLLQLNRRHHPAPSRRRVHS